MVGRFLTYITWLFLVLLLLYVIAVVIYQKAIEAPVYVSIPTDIDDLGIEHEITQQEENADMVGRDTVNILVVTGGGMQG